jgi:anti-sigma factor RsiW
MESPKPEDQKLQMFFDGELPPEEEAAVRRSLESTPEGMAQIREWAQIREAMQTASADWSGEIDSESLFARIEAEVSAPVISIEPARGQTPLLRSVPGGRERRVWGAVATGFAAAAAIFLTVVAWPESHQDANGVTAGARTRGSEVLEVDFGANTGTIFEVEGGAGESLAVVWIDDEEVGVQ